MVAGKQRFLWAKFQLQMTWKVVSTAWWYVLTSTLRHSVLPTFRHVKKGMYRQERRIYHSTTVGVSASRGAIAPVLRYWGCASLVWSVGSTSPTESIVSAAYFMLLVWITEGNLHKNFMVQKRKPLKKPTLIILMLCIRSFPEDGFPLQYSHPTWRKPILDVKRMSFNSTWVVGTKLSHKYEHWPLRADGERR